jgi:hypothetical protein
MKMSKDLFARTKSLLQDHIRLLNEHKIGDSHAEDAQVIVDEISLLLQTDELKQIEQSIDDAERLKLSEEIANEIIHGKYCVGGACDD